MVKNESHGITCQIIKCVVRTCQCVRVHLHVSVSVYDSVYDFMYNLHAKGLGFRFSIRYQLQQPVNTFQEKSVENCRHLVQQIVHRIVHRFVRKNESVEGPKSSISLLDGSVCTLSKISARMILYMLAVIS
jgi:hypothetical protein